MDATAVADRLDHARYETRKKSAKAAFDEIGVLVDELRAEPAPPEQPPEPEVTVPEGAPTWSLLSGFTARTHWDGDAGCIDWYAARIGTGISWPVGGTVVHETMSGPMGTIHIATLNADDGRQYSFTHVLAGLRTGRVERGDVFAVVGDSGIEGLPDAAHIHFACAERGSRIQIGPDGPRGNLAALTVLYEWGFRPELVDRIPSPMDYQAGKARAGRFV